MHRLLCVLILLLGMSNISKAQVQCPCDADIICGLGALDNFTFNMQDFATPFSNFPSCTGNVLNNPNWFAFVAGTNSLSLTIMPSGCNMTPNGNTGIQAAIYGLDVIPPDIPCATCNPAQYVGDALASQCGCVTTNIVWTNLPTVPGQTYYVVIDGCGGSTCDIIIDIVMGGDPPAVDDPTTLMPPLAGFGQDTVCLGATDYNLALDPVFGAGSYVWTLPNGNLASTVDPEILLDFPNPGSFNYCVAATNDCADTSAQTCVTLVVAELAPIMEAQIEICEGDMTFWGETNVEIGLASVTENTIVTYSEIRFGEFDCTFEAFVDVLVINENNTPTVISEVFCANTQTEYILIDPNGPNQVFDEDLDNEAVMIHTLDGCDSFIDLTLRFLNIEMDFGPFPNVACNGGEITAVPETFLISHNPILDPSAEITYTWTRVVDGATVDPNTNDEDLNITLDDFIFRTESFSLTATMTYNGLPAPPCVFGPWEVEINLDDVLPEEASEIQGPLIVCVGDIIQYTALAGLDFTRPPASQFIWYFDGMSNALFTDTDPIAGTIDFEFDNAGTGTLCVATENQCGESDTICIEIESVGAPGGSAGLDDTECSNSYSLSGTGTPGRWIVVDSPSVTANVAFTDPTDPTTNANITEKGVYQYGWIVGSAGCVDTFVVDIDYRPNLQMSGTANQICNGTNTAYTIVFDVTGGAAPYSVTSGNGNIVDSTITSFEILSGEADTITVVDILGCSETFAFNSFLCNCTTMAGTMALDLLTACGDLSCVQGIYNGGEIRDANDITEFVLHDGAGAALGTLIDRNQTGAFCFNAATMTYGTTYYISTAVGDEMSTDLVDLTHGCTRIPVGQACIFEEMPNANAGNADAICGFSYELQGISSVGTGEWRLISGPGVVNFDQVDIPTTTVEVYNCGIYIFEWTETNSRCKDSAMVTIDFLCIPELVNPPATSCNADQSGVNIIFEFMNGTAPYTEINGRGNIAGNIFTIEDNVLDQVDTFRFVDDNGCTLIVPVPAVDCSCFGNPGDDVPACGLTFDLEATGTGIGGMWSAGQTGNPVFGDVNSRITTVTVDSYGTHCFLWTEEGNTCFRTDSVCITFNDSPMIGINTTDIVCNGANTGYTISFDIVGGDLNTYAVTGNGGSLAGNSFTSTEVASGDSYIYIVFDGNGCAMDTLQGDFTCACESQVGVLNNGMLNAPPVHLCLTEQLDVSGLYDVSSENRDANDVQLFVLHDGTGTPFGNILSVNTTGIFNFDAANMNPDDNYKITAIVGTETTGGNIDLQDICLSISTDVNVQWHEDPVFTVTAPLTELDCQTTTIDLSINTTLDLNDLDFTWTASNGGTVPAGSEMNSTINISTPGTYQLLVETKLGQCSNIREITITQSDALPTVSLVQPNPLTCEQLQVTINSTGSDVGTNFEYSWTGPGIVGPTDGTSIAADVMGSYTLTILNTTTNCRASNMITVTETKDIPTAIATVNEMLDCDTDEVTLSGAGSSQGANIQYSWTVVDNGQINGATSTINTIANQEGNYQLEVRDSETGCFELTTVSVEQNLDTVSGFDAQIIQDNCGEEPLGSLTILSIEGGTSPYSYSFDDGLTFGALNRSSDLPPGTYPVIVRDANGCIYREVQDMERPEDFFIELGETRLVKFGDEFTLLAETNLNDSLIRSINWTPTLDSVNSMELYQTFFPGLDQVNVELTVTSLSGCVQTDNVLIAVVFSEDVFIPNVLNLGSPNAENKVVGVFANPKTVRSINKFEIYSRWGDRVFNRTNIPVSAEYDIEFTWDGTKKGEELLPGTYAYVAEVEFMTGIKKVLSGEIILIK